MGEYDEGFRVERRGQRVHVTLIYPTLPGHPNEVAVDLEDVRAADSLLISYDFDRDGWSIRQASTFEWAADDDTMDPDWQEVAFIQAWARDKGDR